MPTSLQTQPSTLQGLGIRVRYDLQERPLSKKAKALNKELRRLGGHVPVTVLLATLARRGHEDASGLLLDGYADAPHAFAFYGL
jgi:hypothetical protein